MYSKEKISEAISQIAQHTDFSLTHIKAQDLLKLIPIFCSDLENGLTPCFEFSILENFAGIFILQKSEQKNKAEISIYIMKEYTKQGSLEKLPLLIGKLLLEILEKKPKLSWTDNYDELNLMFDVSAWNPIGLFFCSGVLNWPQIKIHQKRSENSAKITININITNNCNLKNWKKYPITCKKFIRTCKLSKNFI